MATTTPVQALPIPQGSDDPDVPGDMSALANALETKLNMVFASDAARAAALPAPTEGMRSYLQDSNRSDVFDGAAWTPAEYLIAPRCHGFVSAAQNLTTSGTWQVIALDGEVYDAQLPMHDQATNNSRIVAKVAGLYAVNARLLISVNGTGNRQMMVRKNAAGVASAGSPAVDLAHDRSAAVSSTISTALGVSFDVLLDVNDYIEMFGWQSSGGSLAVSTGQFDSFLQARWVCA